ncbi:MAG TPA: hypothetical protein PLA71_00340 [Saccharofermentans sp.]|nr:hypothetical protein [Saccharofermentans sp.]
MQEATKQKCQTCGKEDGLYTTDVYIKHKGGLKKQKALVCSQLCKHAIQSYEVKHARIMPNQEEYEAIVRDQANKHRQSLNKLAEKNAKDQELSGDALVEPITIDVESECKTMEKMLSRKLPKSYMKNLATKYFIPSK